MNLDSVILSPLVTEKGTMASEKANQVVFRVRPHASKDLVREAIEKLFKVTVLKVRTAKFMGKERRRGQVRGSKPGSCRKARYGPRLLSGMLKPRRDWA